MWHPTWDATEQQLRIQTPPCQNTSILHELCLDISYDLSPVIYRELVESMPRQIAAVLQAECSAILYPLGGHNVLVLQCIFKLPQNFNLASFNLSIIISEVTMELVTDKNIIV